MPFDATLKDLGRDAPADVLTTFDRPPSGAIALLNVDLSTVTTAADLVLGIGAPLAEIVHFDFQSSAAAWKHANVLVYNALIFAEYHVPVHSIVILLRPQAAHANLNGVVSYTARSGRGSMNFTYQVVRLWERPAEEFLNGALGTTPFAMLGAMPEGVPLPDALAVVAQRLDRAVGAGGGARAARKLLTAAFLLTGLRVTRDVARQVFQGVRGMRDSDTYLAILDQGRDEEAKSVILRMGHRRFGAQPNRSARNCVPSRTLSDFIGSKSAMLDATSWQDLLDTP